MCYNYLNNNANGETKMKRGSKEFYEVIDSFEKTVSSGYIGYVPSDFTKDDFNNDTFYANGEVNKAFKSFMAGYAAAKCNYQ